MEWPQILETMQEVLRELNVEGRAEFHVVGGERFHIHYKDRFGVYREKEIPIAQLAASDPAQLKGYVRSLLESYGVLSHE
ncbi:MAG: hypothetical protein HYZ68_02875 [Chloroflexi bacterium]|nr:hypothetical protein [Chloroflexota bacterium]